MQIRFTFHRNAGLKALGIVSFAAYLGLAVLLNLSLAHLREVSEALTSEAGREVMRRLGTAPLGLADITSWIFFAVGFLFSLAAMADGVVFIDPYPGYGASEKAWQSAHTAYSDRKSELIENLRDIRDKASGAMADAIRDLGNKRGEFDSIVQARIRLNAAFGEHQSHLARVGQALVSLYREANLAARSQSAPGSFDKRFAFVPMALAVDTVDEAERTRVRNVSSEAQAVLQRQIDSLNGEFEAAVASYRQIDDLIPEADHGPVAQGA